MANTVTIKRHTGIGDLLLKIVQVTGDGSTTTMTAGSVGLSYITAAWSHSVDDTGTGYISVYQGTSITFVAVDNTKKRVFYILGY